MKKIHLSQQAPAPIGPYSQAVSAGGMLYVSGQIALQADTGSLITNSIEEETHQVLRNLGAVLQAAGCTYADVVKCTIFVADMGQYAQINAVYGQYFEPENAPARELVQVSALPKYVNIEVSCIAGMP